MGAILFLPFLNTPVVGKRAESRITSTCTDILAYVNYRAKVITELQFSCIVINFSAMHGFLLKLVPPFFELVCYKILGNKNNNYSITEEFASSDHLRATCNHFCPHSISPYDLEVNR